MQPYFMPYLGYFSLISSVDKFVVYDDVKYTKKGWINRNKYLMNGESAVFSIPIRKDSDFLNVSDRQVATDFNAIKLLRSLKGSYQKAPYFHHMFPVLERIIMYGDYNLFNFIYNAINEICDLLKIETEIVVSSSIGVDKDFKGKDKVFEVCKRLGATTYINSIGGLDLYKKKDFDREGIKLKFLRPELFIYRQYSDEFVPWLSVLDVLMFNSLEKVSDQVKKSYEIF